MTEPDVLYENASGEELNSSFMDIFIAGWSEYDLYLFELGNTNRITTRSFWVKRESIGSLPLRSERTIFRDTDGGLSGSFILGGTSAGTRTNTSQMTVQLNNFSNTNRLFKINGWKY